MYFLKKVLTESGYLMAIDSILNGNNTILKLLLTAVDNYVELKDKYEDTIVLCSKKEKFYNYAYSVSKNSKGNHILKVHITNIHKREEFRHKSVTAAECDGQIAGIGFNGYLYAMESLVDMINGW